MNVIRSKNDVLTVLIHLGYLAYDDEKQQCYVPNKEVTDELLKFNHTADTAIDQIKRKEYPVKIAEYTGNILLVGINYDKETKQHSCKIETMAIKS